MAITAKELAKKLGLSESAISLALNHKPGVSTATRRRVLAAAEEYGYDFSRITTQETSENHGTIYFVIYKKHGAVVADTPFFSQVSDGVDMECQKIPYYLSIQYLHDGDDIKAHLNNWKRSGCRGIILLGTEMQAQDLSHFMNIDIPLVLLDNYFEEIDVNSVLINNIKGAYTATDYLIRKRKAQPGYLHSSYSINNFEERADGFYKAIRKNGMSTSRSIVHRLTPSVEGAYADMAELIARGDSLADCYFADNDLIAAGAARALKEAGYRIPQDVAIVGFDNMPICTYIEPAMTTIHVPKEYMGQMAVRRLHELITTPDSQPIKIEISTSLQKRRSC